MHNLRNVSSLQSGRVVGYGLFSLVLLLSCLSIGFSQTTYYVATNGNDANSGRSTDSPFQTVAKLIVCRCNRAMLFYSDGATHFGEPCLCASPVRPTNPSLLMPMGQAINPSLPGRCRSATGTTSVIIPGRLTARPVAIK